MQNQVKIHKISSSFFDKTTLTIKQKNLIEELINEMVALEEKFKTKLGFNNLYLFIPFFLVKETISSSYIEGMNVDEKDFNDSKVVDNWYLWQVKNLNSLYWKTFYNNKLEFFQFTKEQISAMHIELYNVNKEMIIKDFDPKLTQKKVKPGKIIKNQKYWNYTTKNNVKFYYLHPHQKESYLEDLVSDIEKKLIKKEMTINEIVRFHPYFEAIHPFRDGNGRIGRLLLSILFAKWKPILNIPINLAEEFAKRKKDYITLLYNLQKNNSWNDWHEWNKFFVNCLLQFKKRTQKRIEKIVALWQKYSNHSMIQKNEKRITILKHFFKNYLVNRKNVINYLSQQNYAISTLYTDFNKVCENINAESKNGVDYYFKELMNIF